LTHHRRVPMARSSRSECHPERREPPSLTLRSSRLTRRLRPLGQRRRGCQHLRQDFDRSLCVSTAPDRAVRPSDLAVDRASLAVDASLCICAIRGASYARSLPFTKSRRSSGSVEARPAIPPIPPSPGSSRMWTSTEIPLESRVAQVRKAQTKRGWPIEQHLNTAAQDNRLLNFLSLFETLLCCALPFGVGTA